MKLQKIIDIDENTAIYADRNQYIVKSYGITSYFGYIEACFQDIFEERMKLRLANDIKKDIKEILDIHKEVARDLKALYRGLEKPMVTS